ncbi:hypothetical protein JCM11491_001512 [Sporobolomyces phaffii]
MPRPPPARAITGCCTCNPGPRSRPTPPRPTSTTPHSLAASPCQSYTTSAATAPVLDFLYPGFGFFSRSLPPLVAGPPPPPPAAPPALPRGGKRALWPHLNRRTPAPPGLAHWTSNRTAVPSACGCGRLRETCLRCRGNSSHSVATASAPRPPVDKGKTTTREPLHDSPVAVPPAPAPPPPPDLDSFRTFFSRLDRTLPSARTSTASPLPPFSSSSSSSSAASTRRRLHRRRFNLVVSSTAPSSSSRPPTQTTDADRDREDVASRLSRYLDEPAIWARLSPYDKLDAIRCFARLTKLVPRVPTTATPVEPLLLPRNDNDDDVVRARERAGERIHHFLEKLERDDGVDDDRTRLSRAGLWIEAFALRANGGATTTIPDPDCETVADAGARGRDEARFGAAIRTVFSRRLSRGGSEDGDGRREGSERIRVQAIRSAVASLFDGWSRLTRATTTAAAEDAGRTPVVSAAEAAFKLVHDYDLAPVLFDDDATTTVPRRRQRVGYSDLLRRQYGLLLGRLGPSPSEWLEAQFELDGSDAGAVVEKGRHLVEYLARSGSAGEARKVWEVVERRAVAVRAGGPGEDGGVAHRLSSLTALVDGLIMDKLYEDANALTRELEDLANLGARAVGGDRNRVAAYRTLAKLASNQGRHEILERVLTKLEAFEPPRPLEAAARRIRSKAARFDSASVEALFDAVRATPEWSDASDEDRARLWSQVIVGQTRINDVEAAIATLRALVAAGLGPPLAAVNAILFGFARRGDVAAVDALFDELARGQFDRLSPDVASWNALVLARTTVKDPSAAARVVGEMRHRGGAVPNRQTWTTLMAGFVDRSQWREAFEIYRYLERHASVDMRPDTATTNVVLKACVLTATPASSVLALFRQLLVRGFRPNMMTYTLVLQSLTSAGLMDLAEELYLMMDRPPTSPDGTPSLPTSMTRVRPDKFTYSTLIAGYLGRGEPAKAKACLAEMRLRGIEPSSITLAIVVGSRLNASSTPQKVQQMVAEARRLLDEDGGAGLKHARRRQPPRRARPRAREDEAVAVFGPIFRSAAKQGLAAAALELLDEVQSRRRAERVPVELYTMLMDAFRRVDDPEAAADNVKAVWDRVYEAVAARFVTLEPSAARTTRAVPPVWTSHVLTTSRLNFRVDPAQAAILSVPFTILVDALARAERHHALGVTWRALARQGFSFDTSNWNALALYFARDLQLERAFWIAEHVLCRPADAPPSPSSSSPASFATELAHVTRSSAVARTPSRLSTLRRSERDRERKHPIDVAALLSSTASVGDAPTPPNATVVDVAETFDAARRVRDASFWHPYGALLETLDAALETLVLPGELELDAAEGGGGGGGRTRTSAAEVKQQLVRDHPATVRAIAMWKTRQERRDRAAERYLSVQGRSL